MGVHTYGYRMLVSVTTPSDLSIRDFSFKRLYKCIIANTSAIPRQQDAHTTYHFVAVQKQPCKISYHFMKNVGEFSGEKRSGERPLDRKSNS